MTDCLFNLVSNLSTPGFFVTAQVLKEGESIPGGLEKFIYDKLEKINQGVKGRKFAYHESGWRVIITFFPTDRVVDERYALKNHL